MNINYVPVAFASETRRPPYMPAPDNALTRPIRELVAICRSIGIEVRCPWGQIAHIPLRMLTEERPALAERTVPQVARQLRCDRCGAWAHSPTLLDYVDHAPMVKLGDLRTVKIPSRAEQMAEETIARQHGAETQKTAASPEGPAAVKFAAVNQEYADAGTGRISR